MSADLASNQYKKVDIPSSNNRRIGNSMPKVDINAKGIRQNVKRLHYSTNTFYKSIAEYIWNGFDAKASEVILNFQFRENGTLNTLSVTDNGIGINLEELEKKFKYVFDSEKTEYDDKEYNYTSQIHGKNGIGRLTFITFANFAKWTTVYTQDKYINCKYDIEISTNSLDWYSDAEKSLRDANEPTGTIVTFDGFLNERVFNKGRKLPRNKKKEHMEMLLIDHLKTEFCWFLELNKSKNYKLIINGMELDYSDIMDEPIYFEIKHEESGTEFKVKYIRWKKSLGDEFSKYYFLNEYLEGGYKETTTFNKKGDNFFHSLYVSSKYFNDFNFNSKEESSQKSFNGGVRSDKIYKYLITELENFIRSQRKPFLREYAKNVIKGFEDEGIIVRTGKDDFELIKIDELENVIQEIYTFQPAIFSSLSKEQKQTIVGLLNLVLNSDEREQVIEIVDNIVKLDPIERKDLNDILKVTNMRKVINTLKLIKSRYEVLEILKQVLFNSDLCADEVHHLQKIVENHTWIFGERYSLVAAAEVDFEAALKNHIKILTDKEEDISVDHPDKRKQVDIFICRQERNYDNIHNFIIELKHPQKSLGETQLSQVKKYMQTVLEIPRFNADNYTWDFLLVGNKFDTSRFLEGELENVKRKGEPGLVYQLRNYKIYVRKWSEILNDCDLRHKFLQEKLELEKDKLIQELKSADDAVELAVNIAEITA